MVDVLLILDGASEPLGLGPTSLEAARTPALDALAAAGTLSRLRTVAPWLTAGSEAAIPALLGWTPPAPVDRGAVEAAAHGIEVAPDERAWRIDVLDADGGRAGDDVTARAARDLQAVAPHHRVRRLTGHRLLTTGPPPLPDLCRLEGRMDPGDDTCCSLRAWPMGTIPSRSLDARTVVVGARGAAIGVARLMGARAVVPAGATGQPDSDLAAKASAALDAIAGGAARVVVHVGGPDEAAHARDRGAKIAALERADRELVAPLAAALRAAGGTLRVCPDHGCDPATGAHDAAPVPCLDWSGGDAAAVGADAAARAPSVERSGGTAPAMGRRLTERAVVGLSVVELADAVQAEAA